MAMIMTSSEARLTNETNFFADVSLALVVERNIESQSSYSVEEFIDVETRLGRNSPVFCL